MSAPSSSATSSAATTAPPIQSAPESESFVPCEDGTRCKTPDTLPGTRPPGWEYICWAPKVKLHKYKSFTGNDNISPMALMFDDLEDDHLPAASNYHPSSDAQTTPKFRKSLA
uniref:Uncharacterized protein n=1 Tax=Panagrellus redivivus TaxID=6233 RepID=A0A7E4VVE6_PANRE